MADQDSFAANILGVGNLVGSDINKSYTPQTEEVGAPIDVLTLKMSDEDLINLAKDWQQKHDGYYPKIEGRAKMNKVYYAGAEWQAGQTVKKGIPSNLIFEAQETFLPEALAKNPEPVVWSDNTAEGMEASNQIKSMLQYKADTMGLRKKLGISLRHWSIYFIGILKHGWDEKAKDFTLMVRNPKNFVWDPDAYIDEIGRYIGAFIGERVTVSAKKLIELFPEQKIWIAMKVDGRLGTKITYTEWWTDEYCFYTFEDIVLDKHRNQFYNYDKTEKNTEQEQADYGLEAETVTPAKNHFAQPMMPYSFFSIFSLQEQPHDITNLIEQSIPNQDRIVRRDYQIDKNLGTGNNSIALSGQSFTVETARQAAQALEDGDPVLVPDGQVDNAIKRIPASALPAGLLQSQEIDKQTLRNIFGTQGLTSEKANANTTARGIISNQNKDSSRIGGGIGESLEQLSDNTFNWWLQLMYVFYDEPHYSAIVGQGIAVQYTQIINSNLNRQFVVSVSPNSMTPKDEVSERNEAVSLWSAKAIDPINLAKKLNMPDPMEFAKAVVLWNINPQQYYQTYFPENQQPTPGQSPQAGGIPNEQQPTDTGLAAPGPENNLLQQVPLQ